MKKILFVTTAIVSLVSTAFAGNVNQDIPVTASVTSSCAFEGDATPLTFKYNAVDGVNSVSGGTTGILHCNFGTGGGLAAGSPATVTVTKPDQLIRTDGTAKLNVSLTVAEEEAYAGAPGTQYYGSDSRTFFVTPDAPLNQWTVPNADYVGTVTVNVDF